MQSVIGRRQQGGQATGRREVEEGEGREGHLAPHVLTDTIKGQTAITVVSCSLQWQGL
ncbi:Protein of unknown function [Gryllus bimaculatus]|nr:Protein of unknown function [Gryllus bimaculatus]